MQCCSQPFVGATHLQMGNWQVIAPEPSPCSARARGPKARISSALDATADIEVATLWTPIRISGMLVDYSQNTIQGLRMSAPSAISRFDRAFFVRLADWVAASVAIALPWSTSAVGIAIAAWLVVLLPTLDAAAVKRELGTAAGGLPVVLWSWASLARYGPMSAGMTASRVSTVFIGCLRFPYCLLSSAAPAMAFGLLAAFSFHRLPY